MPGASWVSARSKVNAARRSCSASQMVCKSPPVRSCSRGIPRGACDLMDKVRTPLAVAQLPFNASNHGGQLANGAWAVGFKRPNPWRSSSSASVGGITVGTGKAIKPVCLLSAISFALTGSKSLDRYSCRASLTAPSPKRAATSSSWTVSWAMASLGLSPAAPRQPPPSAWPARRPGRTCASVLASPVDRGEFAIRLRVRVDVSGESSHISGPAAGRGQITRDPGGPLARRHCRLGLDQCLPQRTACSIAFRALPIAAMCAPSIWRASAAISVAKSNSGHGDPPEMCGGCRGPDFRWL